MASEVAVVTRDGFAGGDHAEWIGLVMESFGIVQGCEERGSVVVESTMGWVGDGEVEEFAAGRAALADCRGELVLGKIPVGALGEVHRTC